MVSVVRDPSKVFADYAVTPASYIVFKGDDGKAYVKNGKTGAIEFSGDDTQVIQYAVDSLQGGGKVFVEHGTYSLSKPIVIDGASNIVLESDGATLVVNGYLQYGYASPVYGIVIRNSTDIVVRGFVFDGNKGNVNTTGTIFLLLQSSRVVVEGNEIKNVRGRAIELHRDVSGGFNYDVHIIHNYIHDTIYASAIKVLFGHGMVALYNRLDNIDQMGFELDVNSNRNIVAFNVISNTGYAGIELDNPAWTSYIIGNILVSPGRYKSTLPKSRGGYHYSDGITIYNTTFALVYGNEIYNPGLDGIRVGDNAVSDTSPVNAEIANNLIIGPTNNGIEITKPPKLIAGNVIIDIGATKKMKNGILSNTQLDKFTVIRDNYIAGYTVSAMDGVIGALLDGNYGYITRSSGTATIPAGSTRTTVSHSLATAPTKVLLTPYGNAKVWVENITSTSFDIVTDASPSQNITVAWYAEV